MPIGIQTPGGEELTWTSLSHSLDVSGRAWPTVGGSQKPPGRCRAEDSFLLHLSYPIRGTTQAWHFGAARGWEHGDGSPKPRGAACNCWRVGVGGVTCSTLMLRAEWQWGIKLPSWHLSGKEVEEEFGFYFSSTQVQLGKASAFRTPNYISLCIVFFCKIDNFLRLKESQRNFTVKLQKSTAISLLCPNSSSGFTFYFTTDISTICFLGGNLLRTMKNNPIFRWLVL